ncbi:hypothetical protein GJAV_G00120370 [Gymnothorax javanicus]|nr:hypothetical protein GJAV_G00120370 [Gymnothorax javanicus]
MKKIVYSIAWLSSKYIASLSDRMYDLKFSPPVAGGRFGRLHIEFSSPMTLERVLRENPSVTDGGKYTSPDCRAKQKKIDYGIYIINQLEEDTFNRAKLLNIGYKEALKDAEYDCFIFSEVDLIPMDNRNHCYDQPRHFAIAMDKFGFSSPQDSAIKRTVRSWRAGDGPPFFGGPF